MKYTSLFLILFVFKITISFSQLVIDGNNYTASELVTNYLLGDGVTVSNITYTGSDFAIGYFNASESNINIREGVILSSGLVTYAIGPNNNSGFLNDSYLFTPGDINLDSLLNYPDYTTDAAILEFDFIPVSDILQFNYVFASEEYPDEVCSYFNDVFGFLISGQNPSGGYYKNHNIAIIPETSTPVSINTINSGQVGTNGDIVHCTNIDTNWQNYNSFFIDNGVGFIPSSQNADSTEVQYDGFTTVLTASVLVVPCEQYHISMSVADGGDRYYDSAVFLEANSFFSEPLKIESSVSYGDNDTLLYEGCGSAKIIIRRTYNIQEEKVYNLTISGSAINGTDYQNVNSVITMQAGQMYDTLTIYPISDYMPDNNETILISIGDTLCNGTYYTTDIDLTIVERDPFIVEIIEERENKCVESKLTAVLSGEFPPVEYLWNIEGQTDSTLSLFPDFVENEITVPVTVNVYDACGNKAYDSINVVFAKYPQAQFSYPDIFYHTYNSNISFTNLSSDNSTHWFWEYGYYNYSSISENTTFTFPQKDNYTVSLKAYNQYNCSDSISKEVIIHDYPNIYIPNAFIPKSSGSNSKFEIKGAEIVEFDLKIYDRWGKLVFISNSIYNSWDGKKNGYYVNSGVYTYVLNAKFSDSQITTRTGSVSVIR